MISSIKMKYLYLILTILFSAFIGLVPASRPARIQKSFEVPVDLVTVSHGRFWNCSLPRLRQFYSNLDSFIERIKLDRDGRFVKYIPFHNDELTESLSIAINSLTLEKINQILGDGNEIVTEVVLANGFQYLFKNWNLIDLRMIEKNHLAKFPIEYVPKSVLDSWNLENVIECILLRANSNSFYKFNELIPKLKREFWVNSKVRQCDNLRFLLDAFHLDSYEKYLNLDNENGDSMDLNEIYVAPYSFVLNYLISFDGIKVLTSSKSLNTSAIDSLKVKLGVYLFSLQTFLHEFSVGNMKNDKLIKIIVEKSVNLQQIIHNRIMNFPEEMDKLSELMELFLVKYSSEIIASEFDGFFPVNSVEACGFSLIPRILFAVDSFEQLCPDKLLSIFMLAVQDKREDPDLNRFLDLISSNFFNNFKFMSKPFVTNYLFLKSFARCLGRNRSKTSTVRSCFKRSSSSSSSSDRTLVSIVEGILKKDFGNLNAFYMRGSNETNQMKFTSIFSSTFIDGKEDNSEEINERFIRHASQIRSRMSNAINLEDIPLAIPSNYKKFGLKMQINEDESPQSRFLDKSRANLREPAKIESGRLRSFGLHDKTFMLTDTSTALVESPGDDDEYSLVEYLVNSEKSSIKSNSLIIENGTIDEMPVELKFMNEMVSILNSTMKSPSKKPKIIIKGSRTSGDGLFNDSLASFGKLISLPKFKTLEYLEDVDGFIPLPFLCPKIMSLIGSWMALCLKYEVPLTWSFAPIFRKFLLREDADSIDFLVEILYKNLFDSIIYRFQSGNSEDLDLLPMIFTSHRMFQLEESRKTVPFLFENRFLELVCSNEKRISSKMPDLEFYLKMVKSSIKRHLLEGRNEFQAGFGCYFKEAVRPYLKHEYIDEFICGHKADAQELSRALIFNGGEGEIYDDFDDSLSAKLEMIEPLLFVKRMISMLNQEQLDQFLWFVTGSSGTILNGQESQRIAFNISVATATNQFCRAQVCFKKFNLVIHERSAKATFSKFLESISNSYGFAVNE